MRTTTGEIISWIGYGLICLSFCYALYLTYWVFIDQLLTTREKLMNYWPCYVAAIGGWVLIKIGVKYD